MRDVEFENDALEEFLDWEKTDKRIFSKIVKLIDECRNDPFTGTGKPEPLKHKLKGYWSRRITNEHRLVYQVTKSSIIIISCRFHY
jgi:toxin YoeB